MVRKAAGVIIGLGMAFGWALIMPQAAFSQEDNQPAVNATAPVDAQAAAPAETATKKNGMVSIDFRDADIKNVLKVLAYNSGVNIVAGPEVTGLVTIQLKDVPWQKALEVVLSTYG